MKCYSLKKIGLCIVLGFGLTILLPGCILGPKDNVESGFASLVSQEVTNMGVNAGGMMDGSGLGKMSANATETTYVDLTINPYSYDAGCGGYVRTADLTTSEGYTRHREDTVWFRDANGANLQHLSYASVKTIKHVRNVTHTNGGDEANVHIELNSTLTVGADTMLVTNGTLSGTYNNESVATGSATDVTRYRTHGAWQFPESGSVVADFPRYKYEVTFTGSGNATADITNKSKDKVTQVNIHVEER